MSLRVAVTSGIYYAARAEELANAIKKVGYTLTRGASAVELAADVAHEVPYTHGVEIRHMAEKQGIDILFHGDLTVPWEIPERSDWRDAHDRACKSIRSAVFAGAKYVNFHACLNVWLEQVTFAGRKVTSAFVDHEGNFISKVLKENEKTREWFLKRRWDIYFSQVLNDDEQQEAMADLRLSEREQERKLEDIKSKYYKEVQILEALVAAGKITKEEAEIRAKEAKKKNDEEYEYYRYKIAPELMAKKRVEAARAKMRNKLIRGGRWHSEELRPEYGTVEGYHIMGNYLYYTNDPQWLSMMDEYKPVIKKYKDILKERGFNYGHDEWLYEAWFEAERRNDREFKEFFYAAVGAKFLEGHLKKAIEWLDNEFIGKELPSIPDKRDAEKLIKIAKDLKIGIENPDARDPSHAGLYFLWRPKQIYSAVKVIRKVLKTDRVMIVVDHEHIATQGVDALVESRNDILTKPDYGSLVICVHSNHPNPLQPHYPIEVGDETLYELLLNLRKTGLGKNMISYLLFERGGGEDPYKQSVDALRLMIKFLEAETPVNKLPPEFYGLVMTAGDVVRQRQIMLDHRFDIMKDLMEVPEEEWGFLSSAATRKGKQKEFKKAELR